MNLMRIIIVLCCWIILTSCDNLPEQPKEKNSMSNKQTYEFSNESFQALKEVSNSNILFAHHSVGNNIILGLQQIAEESRFNLHITSLTQTELIEPPSFVHFSPGKNGTPKSKIDEFATIITENQERLNTQIAFLKFCYIDFTPDTHFNEIFNHYKKTIVQLQHEYPNIIFIHFTIPLTAKSLTPKDRFKGLLGLQVWGDASNVVRKNYNDLLLRSFPKHLVFDIAKIESTHLDGKRESMQIKGQKVYCLAPEFTSDDGHLNLLGQRVVASQLAIFINTFYNQ